MRIKTLLVVLAILLLSFNLVAEKQGFHKTGEVAVFKTDGNMMHDIINFMSSRSGRLGFAHHGKMRTQNVWMLNFMNRSWDFPQERNRLARSVDSVFLKNGKVIHDRIVTYSTKFKVFRFTRNADVHVNDIKRIYYCCTKLPAAYSRGKGKEQGHKPQKNIYYTHLTDGRLVASSIRYLNAQKTVFENNLEINSKDIRLIN
ncbi:MAG: hypothetical protein GY765_36275, partial [bacterium]|nr:hypothetical protein [bacterium]